MSRYAASIEIDGGLRAMYIVGAADPWLGELWRVWRLCSDGRSTKARRMTIPRADVADAADDLSRILGALARAGHEVEHEGAMRWRDVSDPALDEILDKTSKSTMPPEWSRVQR